jgi:hypothetical protein
MITFRFSWASAGAAPAVGQKSASPSAGARIRKDFFASLTFLFLFLLLFA